MINRSRLIREATDLIINGITPERKVYKVITDINGNETCNDPDYPDMVRDKDIVIRRKIIG